MLEIWFEARGSSGFRVGKIEACLWCTRGAHTNMLCKPGVAAGAGPSRAGERVARVRGALQSRHLLAVPLLTARVAQPCTAAGHDRAATILQLLSEMQAVGSIVPGRLDLAQAGLGLSLRNVQEVVKVEPDRTKCSLATSHGAKMFLVPLHVRYTAQ